MAAVDEFELLDTVPDGGPGPDRPPHRGPWSRPLPWLATAAALVLVGSLNATPLIGLAADGPGIALGITDLPLARPPTLAWQVDLTFPQVVDVTGDRVVVVGEGETGRDVLGIDLAAGAEVWHYADHSSTCQMGSVVTCVENPGDPDATIVTMSPEDGARTSTPYPGVLGAITVGEDLVVVEAMENGAVLEEVVLVEADGSERWRVQADAVDTFSTPAWVGLRVEEPVVSLDVSGTSLDLQTGEEVVQSRFELNEGEWVEIVDAGEAIVHSDQGSVTVGIDEALTWVDDDAGGPVVLRQNDGTSLVASLRATGEELWRISDGSCYPYARLLHRFVLGCWSSTGTEGLIGVDELTGESVWTIATQGWVVAASRDALVLIDDMAHSLLALDPMTGTELWRIPWPSTYFQTVSDGAEGLLVSGDATLGRIVWD